MPPPWTCGRNKGKPKPTSQFPEKQRTKYSFTCSTSTFIQAAYHVQDTMLGSGNTTYDPCYQEAGEEKHLNTFLLKVY